MNLVRTSKPHKPTIVVTHEHGYNITIQIRTYRLYPATLQQNTKKAGYADIKRHTVTKS